MKVSMREFEKDHYEQNKNQETKEEGEMQRKTKHGMVSTREEESDEKQEAADDGNQHDT